MEDNVKKIIFSCLKLEQIKHIAFLIQKTIFVFILTAPLYSINKMFSI